MNPNKQIRILFRHDGGLYRVIVRQLRSTHVIEHSTKDVAGDPAWIVAKRNDLPTSHEILTLALLKIACEPADKSTVSVDVLVVDLGILK